MTYYKYAERNASSQINWYEVGKSITDMLAETARIREEKKAVFQQAYKEQEENILNSPQGQNQDVNNFTNRLSNKILNSARLDYQLLTSGQMPMDQYLLRRQNAIDGTKRLYDLSKLFQDEYEKKISGVNSGALQALNIFNMKTVEGYLDFNNSEATIDQLGDGRIGLGMYENKNIDGKEVRVLAKNIFNVKEIEGKILQNVGTFNVEEKTSSFVKNLGSIKDVVYNEASKSKAGTIQSLLGVEFLSRSPKADDATRKVVENLNLAIDNQVASYLDENPYNLASVLTENTGKYNEDSFTFNKEEADNDPSKILVKIDPITTMTTIDKDGKNYDAQLKEAKDWVRNSIISKMDQERSISTTSQIQDQSRPFDPNYQKYVDRKAMLADYVKNLYKLTTSKDLKERRVSGQYFQGFFPAGAEGSMEVTVNPGGKKGVFLRDPSGKENPYLIPGDDPLESSLAYGVAHSAAAGYNFTSDELRDMAKELNLQFEGTTISDVNTGSFSQPTTLGSMSKHDKPK